MRRGHVHQRHSSYRLLSVREKQLGWLSDRAASRQLVQCGSCATVTLAEQLDGHGERCAGSVDARDAMIVLGRRKP